MMNLLNSSQRYQAKVLIAQAKAALDSNNTSAAAKPFYHLFADVFYQVMNTSQRQVAKPLINQAKAALDGNNAPAAAKPFYHLFGVLYQLLSDDSQRVEAKELINQATEALNSNNTLSSFKIFYHLFILFAGAYTYEVATKRYSNATGDIPSTEKSFGKGAIAVSLIIGAIVGFGIAKYAK